MARGIKVGVLPWGQNVDWPALRDTGRRADELGYDSLWTWDHLYPIQGDWRRPIFEGYLTLAGSWIAAGLPLPDNADDPLWAHLTVEAARFAAYDRLEVLHESADGQALVSPARNETREVQCNFPTENVNEHKGACYATVTVPAQYKTLSSKVDDARIATQASASIVQVASPASVPTQKDSPNLPLNILVGGMLGLVLMAGKRG